MSYERQGSGHDPHAAAHELQGRSRPAVTEGGVGNGFNALRSAFGRVARLRLTLAWRNLDMIRRGAR